MTTNKSKTFVIATLTACAVLLLIAAHIFALAWGGNHLRNANSGWVLWIAGGALLVFALHFVIQRVRGNGRSHFHLFGKHAHDHTAVERGPNNGPLVNLGHGFIEIAVSDTDALPRFRLYFYNQRKQPRSVPANATIKIETVRPDGSRQIFDFCAKGECLESTSDIPEPREFAATVRVSHGKHTHAPHEIRFSEHDRAHHKRGAQKSSEPTINANSAEKKETP